MYLFTNIIGSFVLDEKLKIVDSIIFSTLKEYDEKDKTENKLSAKYHTIPLPREKIPQVIELFKERKYFAKFHELNLQLTRQALKASVNEDNLITQAIANVTELDRASNMLVKRLREWYSLYLPEFSEVMYDNQKYAEMVATKTREQLLKESAAKDTMGADLDEVDVDEILLLAKQVNELYRLRQQHESYLEKIMKKYCPNLLELAGVTIGAKLLELGKSLKHLALLPASTIQLLGAEKALFRHIKTGARSPKYGIIINHPLIQNAKKNEKGKAARMLADKLSLCARLDFFKGEFKAPAYRKELEEKLR